LDCISIASGSADIAVHSICIGPISLDSDRSKAVLLDEPFRDECALAVELVRAVRGLTQEHDAGIADAAKQVIVIVRVAVKRVEISSKNNKRSGTLDSTPRFGSVTRSQPIAGFRPSGSMMEAPSGSS